MSKHFAMVGQDTVWAIGTDRQTTIAEARKWATFEPEEWDALAEDGRTGPATTRTPSRSWSARPSSPRMWSDTAAPASPGTWTA